MDRIFTLTRDDIIAELVDADEKSLDQSQKFNSGTVFDRHTPRSPLGKRERT